ncbi:ATP-binding cassette domain-containing protein [Salmonella enterica subsp. enterica]|nr:ATP-binding cassette domain-containing protein [Salmonella enterica subsp. enterica]
MTCEFYDIFAKYCLLEGEHFSLKKRSKDAHDIINNVNDYLINPLFKFSVIVNNYTCLTELPHTFIVEWHDDEYLILQKDNGVIVNLTSTTAITEVMLLNKRVIFLSKLLKVSDEAQAYSAIKKMTPTASYFTLGLIFFALMTPLYSNLFNTRLIYSDSPQSVFLITGIFVAFVVLEFLLKGVIYDKTSSEVKRNNVICNSFFIQLIKNSNCRSAAVKVRTVENSSAALWESSPLISVDMALGLVLLTFMFVMMGIYATPLLMYYILITLLFVHVRFSAYKKNLQVNSAVMEKMSSFLSLEERRKELKFFRPNYFESFIMDKTRKDEYVKMEMNIDNHRWAELIKANSFVSMIVMYLSAYFAVGAGTLSSGSIIAIMIINSRLSGSIVGAVNKIYLTRIHSFHIQSGLRDLFKDSVKDISSDGVVLSSITKMSLNSLSISKNGVVLLSNLNLTVKPGDFVGIVGRSGAGKSSLIKSLSGIVNDYSGTIKIDNINIQELSESVFQNKITYHSANSGFIKGTLRENFNLNGIYNSDDILGILEFCCKNISLSKELIDEKYVDELNFSNGEKQKMLLLMSLYKKPEVIFMDESTSFLSSEDAVFFLSEIRPFYKDSIVFFATHDHSLSKYFTHTIDLSSNNIFSHTNKSVNIPPINF